MTQLVPFTATEYNEAGAHAAFETDIAKADIPTQVLSNVDPPWVRRGVIHEITYRLNPTNAETYTLMLFEGAAAGNYHSNSLLLYESDAARVDDTDYEIRWAGGGKPFNLVTEGTFYIATDWTGAPGDTLGYIRVAGVAYI